MAEVARLKPARPCPICGKPSAPAFHPFCSARCKDVDLNRWLSDRYRIPTSETPDVPPEHSGEDDDEA
jgi:endogenous inhibitor of DNA gyrase (YacG/DUF329 family)